MGKTVRRKHFESEFNTSWSRRGNKVGGFYVGFDTHLGLIKFRELSKEELWKKKQFAHGDGKANVFTPGKYVRKVMEKQHRQHTKLELMHNSPDHEPMVEVKPRKADFLKWASFW